MAVCIIFSKYETLSKCLLSSICDFVSQHIGSVPIMYESHTVHTHALCSSSVPSIFVLVVYSSALLAAFFLSMNPHKSGISGITLFSLLFERLNLKALNARVLFLFEYFSSYIFLSSYTYK